MKGKYNSMCETCVHFQRECSGTKSQVWTGCILKNRPADHVKDYIETMSHYLTGENKT